VCPQFAGNSQPWEPKALETRKPISGLEKRCPRPAQSLPGGSSAPTKLDYLRGCGEEPSCQKRPRAADVVIESEQDPQCGCHLEQ